jgi:Uma2 family endonuclease
MTEPVTSHLWDRPWTFEDLAETPADGNRYEIFDGSLLVSASPAVPHLDAVYWLRRRLEAQAPGYLAVVENAGLLIRGGRSYFIPDLAIVPIAALKRSDASLKAPDAVLVVEVLSKSNAGRDLVVKRHEYAAGGNPQYWIVSKDDRTLTVFTRPDEGRAYQESIVIGAGERFETDDPFPISLDPADFC